MKTSCRSYSAFCPCAWVPTSGSMRDSLSSIRHDWLRLILLCALALAVVLWSAAPARAGAFDDQTASLFPDPDPVGSGFRGGPTSWGDYNNDGYVDISFSGSNAAVWKNNGGTSFSFGGWLNSTGPHVWGDYNNDGLLDVYSPADNTLSRNQSSGGSTSFDKPITMPTRPAQIPNSRGASWADYNGDGYLDLYVAGFSAPNNTGLVSTLMINNSGTSFSGSTIAPITSSRAVTSCDWDSDGDQDFYVSNYHLQANGLWRNTGAATFTNVAGTHNATGGSGHSIGAAWGDIDNDGDFDLFAGNFAHPGQPQSRFLENLGPSADYAFQDNGTCGVAWVESFATPTLGDYDNDGDLDLFFTAVYSGNYPVLYRNDGNWNFTNVTAAEGLSGLGPTYQAAWADIDRDGDLDLATDGKIFVNNVTDPIEGNSNHWLRVHLKGDGTTVNGAAIGSQVRITVGGKTLTRQVEGGTGEGNQNDPTLHFGLGDHSGTVNLVISAPDGTETTVTGVAVDQTVDYVVYSRPAIDRPTLEVFRAGFETSEGYSNASGGDIDLAPQWYGGANNEKEWFSEWYIYTGNSAPNRFMLSDDQANGGDQAVKFTQPTYYTEWLGHRFPEKSTGVVTIQWAQYLQTVSTTNMRYTNNLGPKVFDHWDTNGVVYEGGPAYDPMGPGGRFQSQNERGDASIADADTPNHYNVWRGTTPYPNDQKEITFAGIGAGATWITFKAVCDLDNGTYKLYVDTGSGFSLADSDDLREDNPGNGFVMDCFFIFEFGAFASDDPNSLERLWNPTSYAYIDDVLITWAGPSPFGDANGDWLVDSADLAVWQQNYDPLGLNDNTFAMGDWNDDGFIDSADLALWQQYYDPIGPNSMSAAHVPEPATLFVMTAAGLPLLLKRKFKIPSLPRGC